MLTTCNVFAATRYPGLSLKSTEHTFVEVTKKVKSFKLTFLNRSRSGVKYKN